MHWCIPPEGKAKLRLNRGRSEVVGDEGMALSAHRLVSQGAIVGTAGASPAHDGMRDVFQPVRHG